MLYNIKVERLNKMINFLRIIKNSLSRKPQVKMLGRWNISDNLYLKVDYANLDSCGDRLCGKPNQLTKIINITSNKNINKKI